MWSANVLAPHWAGRGKKSAVSAAMPPRLPYFTALSPLQRSHLATAKSSHC